MTAQCSRNRFVALARGVGCAALLLTFLYSPRAQGQSEFGRTEDTNTNAGTFYYFVQPGTATIRVQVLGTVRAPGMYEISEGTDMGQLLALSGGPPIGVQSDRTRTDATIRLYRPVATGQDLIYEQPLENVIANPNSYPNLQDGDVMMMEVRSRQVFGWRDVTSAITTVGVIALAIERFIRIL